MPRLKGLSKIHALELSCLLCFIGFSKLLLHPFRFSFLSSMSRLSLTCVIFFILFCFSSIWNLLCDVTSVFPAFWSLFTAIWFGAHISGTLKTFDGRMPTEEVDITNLTGLTHSSLSWIQTITFIFSTKSTRLFFFLFKPLLIINNYYSFICAFSFCLQSWQSVKFASP